MEPIAPALEACVFGDNPVYLRLAKVLEYSARRLLTTWSVRVQTITPAPRPSAMRSDSHEDNTQKLEHWAARVQAADEGAPILLIDGDAAILRPLDDVWSMRVGADPFDLAYTTRARTVGLPPFNSGVVFLRANDRTREFLRRWLAENLRMLRDAQYHRPWRARFGGINQAAFGKVLEQWGTDNVRLLELPCVEWNCEESGWRHYAPDRTRILHLKSGLRKAIFHQAPADPTMRAIVRTWRLLERAADAEGACVSR